MRRTMAKAMGNLSPIWQELCRFPMAQDGALGFDGGGQGRQRENAMRSLGEALVDWLEAYGVDTVFGIPGVHTVEMYRGLAASRIAHVTPRHEQGAGFMADGYARATGRVAAAFVITGPGLTNIATAMAQAHADSVPMLVVSAVNRTRALGLGAGDLHEVKRQGLIGEQCAAFSHALSHPEQLPEVLARAWAVFEGARPRPVHIEIPVDMFALPAPAAPVARPAPITPPVPAPEAIAAAAARLAAAERPVILAGGGAAGADVAGLAERLGAPVAMTTNGRGVLPPGHPLALPASASVEAVRRLIGEADLVLAIGTEIGRTDYDAYDTEALTPPAQLIRIEIDPEQMRRGWVPDLPLLGDARGAVAALLSTRELSPQGLSEARPNAGRTMSARTERARAETLEEVGPVYRACIEVLERIRDAVPEAIIVGDSTQAIYAGNLCYAAPAPRRYFNAATGYGALGYGLPAAIGAAIGSGRPTVCIAGDGGLQFSLAELGTAMGENLPLVVIAWNNQGYGEIKRFMEGRQITPVGVDLHTPDFVALAKAYGMRAERVEDPAEIGIRIRALLSQPGPSLVEIDEAVILPVKP